MGVPTDSSLDNGVYGKATLCRPIFSFYAWNTFPDYCLFALRIRIFIITLNVFQIILTHLAFVDDLLIFARGDPDSMKVVKDCPDKFTVTSGLKINKNKSNIFMGGV